MSASPSSRPALETIRVGLLAAVTAAKGIRPGPRFVAAAISGAWVGLAAALAAAPWGSVSEFMGQGGTAARGGWIVGMPCAGALLAVVATWIPSRVARALLLALGVTSLGVVTDGGYTFRAFSIFGPGLAAVSWTLESAVSAPWFARGRARGLLVALGLVTAAAALRSAAGAPEVLPRDVGPWALCLALCSTTALTCLIHAIQDARGAWLVARVGARFEEREHPEGSVDSVATPGGRGRFYLGRLPLRHGRGAYRAGEDTVPVLQLVAPPRTAQRWLVASAVGLGALALLLVCLAAINGSAIAGRTGAGERFLKAPQVAAGP